MQAVELLELVSEIKKHLKGKNMTISEAINHYETIATSMKQQSLIHSDNSKEYRKIAIENRQTAERLRMLREILNSGQCNGCRNGQCKWKPNLGHLVRFNCPHYVHDTNVGECENADVIS